MTVLPLDFHENTSWQVSEAAQHTARILACPGESESRGEAFQLLTDKLEVTASVDPVERLQRARQRIQQD